MSARWAEGREDPRLAVIVRAGGRGSHAVVAETVVGHGQVFFGRAVSSLARGTAKRWQSVRNWYRHAWKYLWSLIA